MTARVIQLIDVQTYLDQQCLNVFHFVDPDGVGDEDILVSDYISDVLPLVLPLQNTGVVHTAIRHRQVFPTDTLVAEVTLSSGNVGTLVGDHSPSFAAASFKFNPGGTVVLAGGFTGHIKRSGARLTGLVDQLQNGNEITDSTYIGDCVTWATELQNPGTDAYLLCVASFLDGARVRQPTVQSYAQIISISSPGLSTQNTRKVLRGRAS